MLALISLDAVARPLLDGMIAQGRLPHLAALESRARRYEMEPELLHASVYRSLYTGTRLSTHGSHYPFQWCAAEQRVKPGQSMDAAQSVFARLDQAEKRVLLIDPPECGEIAPRCGVAFCGWQFTARIVLPPWSSAPPVTDELRQRFGTPGSCHEVFGTQSQARLRAMRETLLASAARLADATEVCLRKQTPDLLWVTFAGPHIAGHQFWGSDLETYYELADAALGRILAALPEGADVIVFSPNGMGPETSRADLLPGMLARILGGEGNGGGSLWRIRGLVPTRLRAAVADSIPEWIAMRIAAALENGSMDWANTRAFALPSDGAGFVRLNLQGRERDGVVKPGDAEGLRETIAEGLRTFVESSGIPVVAEVLRAADLDTPGPRMGELPDLIVKWADTPSVGLQEVHSQRFGRVQRAGNGSGRVGNHCAGSWASVVPGGAREHAPGPGRIHTTDLPATICSVLGVPHGDLAGRPLLV